MIRMFGIAVCCIMMLSLKPLSEATEKPFLEEVVNSLADGYVMTEESGAEEEDSAVSQRDVQSFSSFRFKSAEPLKGSSPPTFLRFRLCDHLE